MRYAINLLLLILLFGCQKKEPARLAGNVMTIDYHILIGDPCDLKEAEKIVLSCFNEVNQIFNKWNPASELSRLNQLPSYTPTPISDQLHYLLTLTDQVYRLSEGRFDPTMNLLETPTGWEKIHFKNGLFWKEHSAIALDLSGIAKGHAIDLILERLRDQLHINNLFVEWGGEIRAIGNHPEGRPWTISIRYCAKDLPLQNCAIATSGNYLQQWSKNGELYTHIIDPRTKKPLRVHPDSIASASVLAPSCALADGLATAAMIFPSLEEAHQWTMQFPPSIQFKLYKNLTPIEGSIPSDPRGNI